MIILGIDPGSRRIGFGFIEKQKGLIRFLEAGILKVRGYEGENLKEIRKQLLVLIRKWHPEVLALEKLYFSQNQKTGLQVAEARGVILLVAAEGNLKVKEYNPNEVKSIVTGYGLADKRAVAKMVRIILKAPEIDLQDDASDALAVALAASKG